MGPLEMSGSPTSVRQTTPRLGPAMRFVADLDNWDHSLICLATGQSGHITSGHYKDQWDEHHTGRAFLLQFDNVKAESTLTLRPGILAGK